MTALAMPFMILPTNPPIASPIAQRSFAPSPTIHIRPGICARPPRAASSATSPATAAAATPTTVSAVLKSTPSSAVIIGLKAAIISPIFAIAPTTPEISSGIASRNEVIRPPTNDPIAFPSFVNIFPPSSMSQLTPGICPSAPRAISTAVMPPTAMANPAIPLSAPFMSMEDISLAVAAIARNTPATAAIVIIRCSRPPLPRALSIASKSVFIILTAFRARAGSFISSLSRSSERISYTRSTICGRLSLSEESTCNVTVVNVSVITGMVPDMDLHTALTSAVRASAMLSALEVIEVHITTIISPSEPAATIRLAERAVMPAEMARIPAPASAQPTPNKATAADSFNMVPTSGFRSSAESPITVNAPASVSRAVPTCPACIFPSALSSGTRSASAPAAISREAEPAAVRFIILRAAANISREPPTATRPFATPSQLIPLIFISESASIATAAPTITNPVPIPIRFFGMSRTAIVTAASAPAMPDKPFARPSQLSFERSVQTEANILSAPPIAASAMPVDITCLAFPVRFTNSVISARSPAIPASPFPSSPQLSLVRSAQTEAIILSAAASTTTPAEVRNALLPNFAVFRKISSSASSTAIPASPLASSSQPSLARSAHTEAMIFSAAARITSPAAPLTALPFIVERPFAANISSVMSTATPESPLAIPFQSSDARFFIAADNISTAVAIPFITMTAFAVPLILTFILLNAVSAPISSTKSTLRPASAEVSRDWSMLASSRSDTERIPTACAIFIRVPALSCCCHPSRQPLTPSSTPVTPPRISLTPPKTSVKPFVNFRMLRSIPANIPPFTMSITPFIPPVLKALERAPPTCFPRDTSAPPSFTTRPNSAPKILPSASKLAVFIRSFSAVANSLTFSLTTESAPVTFSSICAKISLCVTALCTAVSISPIAAAAFRSREPSPDRLLSTENTTEAAVLTSLTSTPSTENIPRNTV